MWRQLVASTARHASKFILRVRCQPPLLLARATPYPRLIPLLQLPTYSQAWPELST